jgi:hypothetical protein
MPVRIRRIPTPDGEVQAREEDFEPVQEPWSVYRLKDGGEIRVRATILSICRVLDAEGKPTFMPDGQPAMLVQNEVQIVASE